MLSRSPNGGNVAGTAGGLRVYRSWSARLGDTDDTRPVSIRRELVALASRCDGLLLSFFAPLREGFFSSTPTRAGRRRPTPRGLAERNAPRRPHSRAHRHRRDRDPPAA